jgi:hypothetical protein
MSNATKVAVSARALLQRINRKLAKEDEMIRKSRPGRRDGQLIYNNNTGEYYRIDIRGNFFIEGDVDLSELGLKLGVLRKWEALAEEEK